MIPQAMLKITEIVKDDILEIIFSDKQLVSKSYTILCERGTEIMKGKIAGFIRIRSKNKNLRADYPLF